MRHHSPSKFFFFFNDPATTEIYPLSLHDALPICSQTVDGSWERLEELDTDEPLEVGEDEPLPLKRSEEHTSELQSRLHLVCRLLLEKKKRFQPARRNFASSDCC